MSFEKSEGKWICSFDVEQPRGLEVVFNLLLSLRKPFKNVIEKFFETKENF